MFKLIALATLVSMAFACPDERNCMACVENSTEGLCQLCFEGFVNPNTKKCTPIPTASLVDNCIFYEVEPGQTEPIKKCNMCNLGYKLVDNKCLPCKVENCAICMDDINVCTACKNSKKVEFTEGKSVCTDKPTEMQNCEIAAYTSENKPWKCEKCVPGHVLNEEVGWTDNCQKSKIKNCMIINNKSADKCLACDFGYYVTKAGTCASNSAMSLWGWLLLVVVLLAIAGIGYGIYQWVWKNNPNTLRVAAQQPLIN